MKTNPVRRLYLIIGLFVVLGCLLAGKLFFTQIIVGQNYRQTAERQYRQTIDEQVFNRGSIFFETKDGTLISGATLQSSFTLAVNPAQIDDQLETYETLKTIFPKLDEAQFMAKTSDEEDPYEEIQGGLTSEEATTVRALNLPGVQMIEKHYRAYPGGELAAHILGFMGYEGANTMKTGRYGLEKQYDKFLNKTNELTFSTFLSELFSATVHSGLDSAEDRGDIVLTIEPSVQRFLEDELETIMTKWQTRAIGGLIIEPKTGAILALAARPTFDPGEKQSDLTLLTNPLIENVYEMGSVMKPITVASGLDAGVINKDTHYVDAGQLLIDGKLIGNYDGRARGDVPIQEILNQSLNTGAIFIMKKIGQTNFKKYLDAFNLGHKTGIDLPGESSGLLGNLASNREVEFATASFGQGIALTPLNLAMALSTLANNGELVQPRIVKRFRYETGLTEETPVKKVRQVVKAETAKQVTEMLVKTVDEVLDGGRARLPHYLVAAKTGTAQIPRIDNQGYEINKYLHSFFGYFPASAPRFSVFLYALEPVGASYASQTLTTPFTNIAKFLLNYYQVAPDRLPNL